MVLLDFKLNSSPRPELFSSPLAHPWSAQPQSVPGVPNSTWSAQSLPGVPNPRFSQSVPELPQSFPELPNPESPSAPEFVWSAQKDSSRASPECPRVSLQSPTPESPWSAQPQSVPGVPSPRVSLECPTPEYLYQERVGMFEVK